MRITHTCIWQSVCVCVCELEFRQIDVASLNSHSDHTPQHKDTHTPPHSYTRTHIGDFIVSVVTSGVVINFGVCVCVFAVIRIKKPVILEMSHVCVCVCQYTSGDGDEHSSSRYMCVCVSACECVSACVCRWTLSQRQCAVLCVCLCASLCVRVFSGICRNPP